MHCAISERLVEDFRDCQIKHTQAEAEQLQLKKQLLAAPFPSAQYDQVAQRLAELEECIFRLRLEGTRLQLPILKPGLKMSDAKQRIEAENALSLSLIENAQIVFATLSGTGMQM